MSVDHRWRGKPLQQQQNRLHIKHNLKLKQLEIFNTIIFQYDIQTETLRGFEVGFRSVLSCWFWLLPHDVLWWTNLLSASGVRGRDYPIETGKATNHQKLIYFIARAIIVILLFLLSQLNPILHNSSIGGSIHIIFANLIETVDRN